MTHENSITIVGAIVYTVCLITTAIKFQISLGDWFLMVLASWFVVVPTWVFILLVVCPRLPETRVEIDSK